MNRNYELFNDDELYHLAREKGYDWPNVKRDQLIRLLMVIDNIGNQPPQLDEQTQVPWWQSPNNQLQQVIPNGQFRRPIQLQQQNSVWWRTPSPIRKRQTNKVPATFTSIQEKLKNITYDQYYPSWRDTPKYYTFINNVYDIDSFAENFKEYQNITIQRKNMNMVGWLMTYATDDFIIELMLKLGYKNLSADIDTFFNLLWYINADLKFNDAILDEDERGFISGLSEHQLMRLLGKNYNGPTDKASLLFAATMGKITDKPDINNIAFYPLVKNFNSRVVWILASKKYNIINKEFDFISGYPPYIHVAINYQPSYLDEILKVANESNVDNLMEQYQISLPTKNIPQTQNDKLIYFINQILDYDTVFDRKNNITLPPPSLETMNGDHIKKNLARYTTQELVEGYEPMNEWYTRKKLITKIKDDFRNRVPIWAWRHGYCNNDDTENVIELELHGEIDKDNVDDPTLSYGIQRNYRCYQVSELIPFFDFDNEGVFHFGVPDYIPDLEGVKQRIIDPTTGNYLVDEFSVQSIKQLRELLANAPNKYNGEVINELMEKIDEGLAQFNTMALIKRNIKIKYNKFNEDEKRLADVYITWLFLYGMWLNFWKGPNYPWPLKSDDNTKKVKCTSGQRDIYVIIQLDVRSALLEEIEKYPNLNEWVKLLPIVKYDFTKEEGVIATGNLTTLDQVVDLLQNSDFCLSHGSDIVIQSAYYIIKELMNPKTNKAFTKILVDNLPTLNQIEKDIIARRIKLIPGRLRNSERQLAQYKNMFDFAAIQQINESIYNLKEEQEILPERLRVLNNPNRLFDFDPNRYKTTKHIDPANKITFDK
jgi:hypothetical protein